MNDEIKKYDSEGNLTYYKDSYGNESWYKYGDTIYCTRSIPNICNRHKTVNGALYIIS